MAGFTNGWQPSDPEVARLRDRVLAWEAAVTTRLDELDRAVAAWAEREKASHETRRARTWQVALAITTGLLLPLTLIGVLALLHLRQ